MNHSRLPRSTQCIYWYPIENHLNHASFFVVKCLFHLVLLSFFCLQVLLLENVQNDCLNISGQIKATAERQSYK